VSAAYRYPSRALAADYASSAAGAGIFLAGLAALDPAPAVAWVLAAGAALFLVYFGRTVCRQLTRIEVDETGIRASGPLGEAIRWEDLRSLRLDYYSTRRDQEEGWMQLRLRGAGGTIRADSALAGFAELVRAAVVRARGAGIELDDTTRANLALLEG
jgi:hypothetical protein